MVKRVSDAPGSRSFYPPGSTADDEETDTARLPPPTARQDSASGAGDPHAAPSRIARRGREGRTRRTLTRSYGSLRSDADSDDGHATLGRATGTPRSPSVQRRPATGTPATPATVSGESTDGALRSQPATGSIAEQIALIDAKLRELDDLLTHGTLPEEETKLVMSEIGKLHELRTQLAIQKHLQRDENADSWSPSKWRGHAPTSAQVVTTAAVGLTVGYTAAALAAAGPVGWAILGVGAAAAAVYGGVRLYKKFARANKAGEAQ
jgi:hypothetical protein